MIELKYFDKEDLPQLMGWIGDSPELLLQWSGLSMKYPLTVEQLEQYVNKANHDYSDVFAFKAIHVESGKTIGHISLSNINRDNGSARMARVLIGDSSMHGKGMGQLMVKEILNIAFLQLKLHKVSLAVFDFNVPAIKLYEKAGFTTEGFIRDACKIGERYWSYFEMSILEREWQETVNRIQE